MAKAPQKKVVKKTHPLEPVVRELVDQVTILVDTFKTKPPVVADGGPPPVDPPPPISPPPPPPPPAPCDCSGLCEFVATKPLVKSRLMWNPDKEGGAGWDWDPV